MGRPSPNLELPMNWFRDVEREGIAFEAGYNLGSSLLLERGRCGGYLDPLVYIEWIREKWCPCELNNRYISDSVSDSKSEVLKRGNLIFCVEGEIGVVIIIDTEVIIVIDAEVIIIIDTEVVIIIDTGVVTIISDNHDHG
jgi:hypothetical protein